MFLSTDTLLLMLIATQESLKRIESQAGQLVQSFFRVK